ncbi:serine hydrolase domain-containing protein [Sphingomonas glaciei]|uniref:Beta-lactamase family protein n=1 Tax=Sphingomonas glaciei TaxID=2938948 RepID=A0ABY5MXQ4_9SPHN|nr:serine hydrolase domain-containing protein [Sphingomonas glaciei]UUR09235.1 beta-lactamase family protein [Sphingomonas glaciei]
MGAAIASIRVVEPFGTAQSQAADVRAASLRLAKVQPTARQRIDYARLNARLKRLAEKPTMVGMAVGIVENGRITFLSGYGETLEGSGEEVTADTVFRWASVSKGVAGTMVAKLAEQGKIQLDGPVVNYAPGLKLPAGNEYRASVTDVLSHRLGLYRNALDNKLEEGQSPQVLRAQLGTLNAICPPDTCWSYQNIAFDSASDMVARATGTTYQEAVRQQLFGPLGMTSATLTREGLVSAKSWARPHTVGRRPLEVLEPYYRVPAAGGVNSNIKDMSLWMIAQMGGMPAVLDQALLDKVHAPLVKTPGERARLRKFLERVGEATYGLGWRNYDYAGRRIIGHRGGVNGYRSLILFDPALKSGVVALWNSNTSQPGGLEFEVMDMLHGLEFRDWMELDKVGGPPPEPASEEIATVGSGDRR